MKRILFVDDEPKVLEGLRRMLRSLRRDWDMEFAEGGAQALERLAASPVDVVVTDMRMPGMDGCQLLNEVMNRYPGTVRIILSGQCHRQTVLKAVGPAHQFLTKPCDSEVLRSTVARACRLRDRLCHEWHKQLVSRVTSVPSMPSLHAELVTELQSPGASIQRVGEIIARDVGMTAKIMQLVSTDFFGTRQRLSDPIRAASLFDLETIRELCFSTEALSPFTADSFREHLLEMLIDHSAIVAKAAREIAKAETQDKLVVDDAYLAGFLHDIGILVLAQHMSESYVNVVVGSGREQMPLWEMEQKHFMATHADVGGYLIALWGLPDPIVQAVTLHHYPSCSLDRSFSPLAAVHVANVVAGGVFGNVLGIGSQIDAQYLQQIGLAHRLEAWQEICRSVKPEEVAS